MTKNNSQTSLFQNDTYLTSNNRSKNSKHKIPFLQYQIMECIYEGPRDNIEEKVGYPKGSLVLKNAIKSLKEKGMLTESLELTKIALLFVKKQYNDRHNYQKYYKDQLQISTSSNYYLFNYQEKNKNGSEPIFRWYKYLEDFPHHFVEDCIDKYKISKNFYILDPFAGSGTTLIRSKLMGLKSIGIDVNPTMVFISQQKLNWNINTNKIINHYNTIIDEFVNASKEEKDTSLQYSYLRFMPKKELDQWLSPVKQNEVSLMFKIISKINNFEIKDFFKFVATRAALESSYVAYCPGTTFYPFRSKPDFLSCFNKIMKWVLEDLNLNDVKKIRSVKSIIVEGNVKDNNILKPYNQKVDLIITSPPYPNDLEYTRQTRLEMYLLGFVKSMKDVQTIKRKMVKGSTKLIFNIDKPLSQISELDVLKTVTKKISYNLRDKNWGFDYPKMVNMYFSDMFESMKNFHKVLVKNGTCVMVVGDQTIKGVLIPVAKILLEIGKMIGFRKGQIELHRKRRSTNHNIDIPEENLILTK